MLFHVVTIIRPSFASPYILRRDVLEILPDLTILDGELLDEERPVMQSRRTSKSSTKHSISTNHSNSDGSESTLCLPR